MSTNDERSDAVIAGLAQIKPAVVPMMPSSTARGPMPESAPSHRARTVAGGCSVPRIATLVPTSVKLTRRPPRDDVHQCLPTRFHPRQRALTFCADREPQE